MTEPLSPEHLEELMTGYVLGSLSPEEAEEFRQLLAENSQMATEVQLWRESLELLPYALPEVEPPPHLHAAILNAVQPESNIAPVRERPGLARLPWSKIVASIAALFALALGLDNYRLRQELKTAQTQKAIVTALQQPHTRVYSLTGTDKANTASGSVVLNLEKHKAVVAVQHLPTPSAGQIYRLWAIINDKKIACAQFKTNQQGTVLDEFSLPVAACSSANLTLAVTLEPLPSPPQPVGPAVMVERS